MKYWTHLFFFLINSEKPPAIIPAGIATIPIPGANTTLNGPALLNQAVTEQKELREELKKTLDELTYAKVAEGDGVLTKAINEIQQKVPMTVYVG